MISFQSMCPEKSFQSSSWFQSMFHCLPVTNRFFWPYTDTLPFLHPRETSQFAMAHIRILERKTSACKHTSYRFYVKMVLLINKGVFDLCRWLQASISCKHVPSPNKLRQIPTISWNMDFNLYHSYCAHLLDTDTDLITAGSSFSYFWSAQGGLDPNMLVLSFFPVFQFILVEINLFVLTVKSIHGFSILLMVKNATSECFLHWTLTALTTVNYWFLENVTLAGPFASPYGIYKQSTPWLVSPFI